MVCKNCGTEGGNAKFCPNCGAPLFQPNEGMQNQQFQQPQPTMQFQPNTTPKRKNTIGVIGLVFSILATLFAIFAGGLGCVLGIIGLVLSIIGACKKYTKKAAPIVGIVFSCIAIFLGIIIAIFALAAVIEVYVTIESTLIISTLWFQTLILMLVNILNSTEL